MSYVDQLVINPRADEKWYPVRRYVERPARVVQLIVLLGGCSGILETPFDIIAATMARRLLSNSGGGARDLVAGRSRWSYAGHERSEP